MTPNAERFSVNRPAGVPRPLPKAVGPRRILNIDVDYFRPCGVLFQTAKTPGELPLSGVLFAMNFELSEDQRMMRETFARFLDEHSTMARVRAAMPGGFDPVMWKGLAELGAFSLRVPEDLDGLGLGLMDAVVLMEEAGRTLASGPIAETLVCGATAGAVRRRRSQQIFSPTSFPATRSSPWHFAMLPRRRCNGLPAARLPTPSSPAAAMRSSSSPFPSSARVWRTEPGIHAHRGTGPLGPSPHGARFRRASARGFRPGRGGVEAADFSRARRPGP